MRKTDNGLGPRRGPAYQLARDGSLPRSSSLYERLIEDGIAHAHRRGGSIVDHATAGGWPSGWPPGRSHRSTPGPGPLRPYRSDLPRAAAELRMHARSGASLGHSWPPGSPTTPPTAALELGPIGENFGAACDQIDRSDVCSPSSATGSAWPYPPSRPGRRPTAPGIALARPDPQTQTVTLVLDAATANVAMFAIAAHADEREAHLREVERFGQNLPEGSYGRRNRQAIAARETRIAARLRAVQQAYRTATERDTAHTPPAPAWTPRSPELRPAGRSSWRPSRDQRKCGHQLPPRVRQHQAPDYAASSVPATGSRSTSRPPGPTCGTPCTPAKTATATELDPEAEP